MSFYRYHLFFCTNQREDGARCCQDFGASEMRDYAKRRCKELGIHMPGKVRVNNTGCFNRCAEGPVLVVYPEGTWYSYAGRDDIDEIINEHLLNGQIVERLKI